MSNREKIAEVIRDYQWDSADADNDSLELADKILVIIGEERDEKIEKMKSNLEATIQVLSLGTTIRERRSFELINEVIKELEAPK